MAAGPGEKDDVVLSADVQRLAAAVTDVDGTLGFDPKVLEAMRKVFVALPPEQKRDRAAELVALGMRVQRDGARVDIKRILTELLVLTIGLVGTAEAARDLFQRAGVKPAVALDAAEGDTAPSAQPDALWK